MHLLLLFAFLVAAKRICISNSRTCPLGYDILSTNDFTTTDMLDAYVQTQSSKSSAYVESFKNLFDCPNFTGNTERYHSSVLCYFVSFYYLCN